MAVVVSIFTETGTDLRTTPVQLRSAERMTALLDAAAQIIHEEGIDAVTTTAVAYKSGSSVGVLYRYFPNIDSLLRALAQRNLSLYLARVEQGADSSSDEPWSSWDRTLDSFVELCRSEPGFRALRFGEIITDRFLTEDESNNSVIARAFASMVSGAHAVPITEEMLFHLEVAVTMGQGLLSMAFRTNPEGDQRTIEEARRVIGEYLRNSIRVRASE